MINYIDYFSPGEKTYTVYAYWAKFVYWRLNACCGSTVFNMYAMNVPQYNILRLNVVIIRNNGSFSTCRIDILTSKWT